MQFTPLTPKEQTQSMLETFGGYNHTPRPSEAEFYDMKNMTSDGYPMLSTRQERGVLALQDTFCARDYKDGKLIGIENSEKTWKLTVKKTVEAQEKPTEPEVPEGISIDNELIVRKTDDFTIDKIGKYIYYTVINTDNQMLSDTCTVSRKTEVGETIKIELSTDTNIDIPKKCPIGLDFFSGNVHNSIKVISIDKECIHMATTSVSKGDDLNNRKEKYNKQIFVNLNGVTFVHEGEIYRKFRNEFSLCRATSVWSEEIGGTEGYEEIHIKISLEEFYRGVECEETIDSFKEYYAREIQWTSDNHGFVLFGGTQSLNAVHFSLMEYESKIEEENQEYAEAYAQYMKDLYAPVQVSEQIPPDFATNARKGSMKIDGTEYYCNDIDTKENILYIAKPIPSLKVGTKIDTQMRTVNLTQYDMQTETMTNFPIGADNGEKNRKIVKIGSDIVLFPDKIRVNTKTQNGYADSGAMESESRLKSYTGSAGKNSISTLICTCVREGDKFVFENIKYSGYLPSTAPTENAYCMDSWSDPENPKLKQYSVGTKMWSTVETYLKIYSVDLDPTLAAGDSVQIFRGEGTEDNKTLYNYLYFGDKLFSGNDGGSHLIYDAGKEKIPESLQEQFGKLERNYIVIKGIVSFGTPNGIYHSKLNDKEIFRIKRSVPEMDFVIECNNRLWGCRYGKNADGEFVNEIYASKLGDPKNWYCYEGTAMDSYCVSLGTDGAFTGAVVYAGTPIFFKENYMHRIYGSYPANFQVLTQTVRGVQPGSDRSLAVVNESLFYKSNDCICVYDGSLPYSVSDALGTVRYLNAIGAGANGKYYVSLETEDYERVLMVFDISKRMWHKEDEIAVRQLIPAGDTLVCVTQDRKYLDMLGKYGKKVGEYDWYAETGNIGYSMAGKKYVGRMLMRFQMEQGAFVRVCIAYDDEQAFRCIETHSDCGTDTLSIPVRPRRCDHFRLRIEGKGKVRLISMAKTIKRGSNK